MRGRARRERTRDRERGRRREPGSRAGAPSELPPRARGDPLPPRARHARGDRRARRGPLRPRARPRPPAAGRVARLPRRGLAGAEGPLMRRSVLAAAALVALAIVLATLPIGSDVYEGGEASEGLVVREMLRTGDWILPLWNGSVVPSKPPLFHWLAAGAAPLTRAGGTQHTPRRPSIALAGGGRGPPFFPCPPLGGGARGLLGPARAPPPP